MHVVDRHPACLGELPVDLADQQLNFAPEFLVVWYLFAAWHHHLQQRYPMPQLREAAQQNAKGFQPLWNTLCVVHAVDAEDNKIVGQLVAQLCGQGLDVATGSVSGEFLKGNADGKSRDAGAPVLQGNYVVRIFPDPRCLRNNAFEAAQKISAIALGLKAEQVILQQGTQNLLAPWQLFKNIGRRKRNVKKEAHPRIAAC